MWRVLLASDQSHWQTMCRGEVGAAQTDTLAGVGEGKGREGRETQYRQGRGLLAPDPLAANRKDWGEVENSVQNHWQTAWERG
jgi:hypothetical protein